MAKSDLPKLPEQFATEPKCKRSAGGRHQRVVEQEFDEDTGRLISQKRGGECRHCGEKIEPSAGDKTQRVSKTKRDRRDKGGETRER